MASALGILETEQAAKLLDVSVLMTVPLDDPMATQLAQDVIALLSRTINEVALSGIASPTLEVVIGDVDPCGSGSNTLYVSVSSTHATIGSSPTNRNRLPIVASILRRLIACYVSAAVMKRVVPPLEFPLVDPLTLQFDSLGVDLSVLDEAVQLGKVYLAGAGAIGNALLWAMQGLNVSGELHVVDFDHVEEGNLQRQLWFDNDDIGKRKCERLVEKAQPYFPNLTLIPRHSELQCLPEKNSGAWLAKLIVAVDSRRVRRRLQEEVLPGEIFDASTTDITEVVVHYHRQPTQHACLSCIYAEDAMEQEFEIHIATQLGVPVEKVRESLIDLEAAEAIARKYPDDISGTESIVGLAYDSLFKSLCGTGKLSREQESATVVPFAFVSALAGILLGFELLRRHTRGNHDQSFNYWKVSPWHTPFARNRRLRPRRPDCVICGNPLAIAVLEELWGGDHALILPRN
ncbi:conserved hypothetical protein [Ralstonia solanacearum K60]|nr:conserved hypothetical protein [Ralstonia solanacearum K60]